MIQRPNRRSRRDSDFPDYDPAYAEQPYEQPATRSFGGAPPPSFMGADPRPQRAAPAVSRASVTATVKWFNSEKGFGFVALDDNTDAFLHVSVLMATGYSAAAEGDTLTVDVGTGDKGPQVLRVSSISKGTAPQRTPPRPAAQHAPKTHVGSITGTVKWYNITKGYGFVVPDDGGKDIFLHVTALEKTGLREIAERTRVVIDIVEGRKGPEVDTLRLA